MDRTLSTGRFYGRTIRRREIPGVTVSEVRFPGEVRVPPHAHERPIFNFVLSGGYTEFWSDESVDCAASALLFHPVGLVHSERFSREGARCLTMEFDPAALDADAEVHRLEENTPLPRGRWTWVAARARRELFDGDDLSPIVLDGLLRILVGEAARSALADRRPPPFVRTARDLLRESFTNPPRIADIATEVGVHPSHLTRSFRRHLRCTPGEYARRLRFEHAARLLEETDRPLAAIAQAAGFADQSHFTRAFRRWSGSTPGDYRDALAGR